MKGQKRRALNRRLYPAVAVAVVALLGGLFPVVSLAASPNQLDRSLVLTPLPQRLPTNSSGPPAFPALVVSINDPQGDPLVATNDTTVYLTSSQSAVLSVQPTVVITAGAQYAIANVFTTGTPGNSTVAAVSPGFESASAVFQTYTPRGYPSQLRVYPLPADFPPGKPSSAGFAVVVTDAAGLPARAVQATTPNVESSDTSILKVGGAQIPLNGTVAYGTMSTSGAPGTAAVTVSSPGFVSDSALVTVGTNQSAPVALQVSAPPTGLPADGGTYNMLTVALLDNQSRPSTAGSPVRILLSSSRTDIGTVPPTVEVRPGESFVSIPITTSPASGSTIITASAPDFVSSTAVVDTVSIPPTQLGVYLADKDALVSSASNTLNMVIQLQDSQGVPARARAPANVIISFSDRSLLQAPLTLTIPKGSDLVYTSLPIVQGTAGTFTAISNGLNYASVKFSASVLPVSHSLGAAPQTIRSNQTTTLYFSVQSQGRPLPGASITWSAQGGTISPSSGTTDGAGASTATFTPSSAGVAVVTVTASDPVVGDFNATLDIIVTPVQAGQSPSLLSMLLSFPYVLGSVGAVVAALLALFTFVRRRRKGEVTDEDSFSMDETPGGGMAFRGPAPTYL